ncbi:MAG: lipopolysaccharide biosynthesis protein [Muribaculaceae bacterium]|nr:lipopolysaccharide biosynthesis protein [Muribaculaceae bacterium]
MPSIKTLGKDTAMYGISTVLARFLNYFIVPIQTYSIAARSGEYGTITNMYAYTSLVLLLLICGMESTFFYFVNREEDEARRRNVFATAMTVVGTVTAVFLAVVYGGIGWIAPAMGYVAHPEYVLCMATVVAMDALQTVPFARLRQERRGWVYVGYKLLFVVLSLVLNTVFYVVLPWLATKLPDSVGRLYASNGVDASYAFYINIACTTLITVLMYKEFAPRGGRPDGALLRQMLGYTWPLMIVAVAGQMTQSFDKMFYNALSTEADSNVQLGIYGACAKIAMFMVVATQAYRMALEPLVYANRGDKEDPSFLGNGTKLFLVTLLVFFIGIMAWMDVLRYFVGREYWDGLFVVPVVMAAEVCYAIFLNFSYWYKTDSAAGKANTLWGALFSLTGCAIIVAGNVLFVPRYGYVACAWASLASWAAVMVFSYLVGAIKGRLHMPLGAMLTYVALAAVALWAVMSLPTSWPSWLRVAVGTVITVAYAAFAIWREGLIATLRARCR